MTLDPRVVWPLAVLLGVCAGLAYSAVLGGASFDVVGYVLAAFGGALVGHIMEARHAPHWGPHVARDRWWQE